MKKLFKALFLLFVSATLFCSCSLLETGNGNLRGTPEPEAIPLTETHTQKMSAPSTDPAILAKLDQNNQILMALVNTLKEKENTPAQHQEVKNFKNAPTGAFGKSTPPKNNLPPKKEKSLEEAWKAINSLSYRVSNVEKSVAILSLRVMSMKPGDMLPVRIGSFASDSAELSPKLINQIDAVVKMIKKKNLKVKLLLGFSSPEGDAKENLKLSGDRANNVKSHLDIRCIDVSAVKIVPRGESVFQGALRNNRSVIILLEQGIATPPPVTN